MDISKEKLAELAIQAADDPEAFGELYDYFFPKIYHYIYNRVNDQQLAEDLVSDIFMKILKNLDTLKHISEVQGWFFSIARNTLIDYYRKKGRNKEDVKDHLTFVTSSTEPTVPENNPESAYISKEHSQEIFKLLQSLSPDQQEVLTLRFCHDLKINEIADVIEKSEGAVKGLLYRGIKKLAQTLDERGENA